MEEFIAALTKIGAERDIDINSPEGLTSALVVYEQTVGPPLLDVVMYQGVYGRSSGWARYSNYIEEGAGAGPNGAWARAVRLRNPGLPWAVDAIGLACHRDDLRAQRLSHYDSHMALCYHLLGDDEQARALARSVLAHDPQNAGAALLLAAGEAER